MQCTICPVHARYRKMSSLVDSKIKVNIDNYRYRSYSTLICKCGLRTLFADFPSPDLFVMVKTV